MAAPPLVRRLANAQYRLYDLMRSRSAFGVARQPPSARDFAGFRGVRQCLVVTFRRSGEPMPSPVNFGLGDDHTLYLRTDPHTGKVKRIRNNPRVLVVPSGMFGKPRGPAVEGRARILAADEIEAAERAIKANFSRPMAVLEAGLEAGAERFGVGMTYVEITPQEDRTSRD
ncbi:MAG: PPOX class F420-dependent oxidoreductase [Micromonosporaceae bacterium]